LKPFFHHLSSSSFNDVVLVFWALLSILTIVKIHVTASWLFHIKKDDTPIPDFFEQRDWIDNAFILNFPKQGHDIYFASE